MRLAAAAQPPAGRRAEVGELSALRRRELDRRLPALSRPPAAAVLQRPGFTPNVSFETEDYVAVLGLVAEGLGVALIPDLILRSASHPDVVTLPIDAGLPPRRSTSVTTADLQRVPAVKATLDALCESAHAPARVLTQA